MSITSLLGNLFRLVLRFSVGAVTGVVAGFAGGELGIKLRDRYNETCTKEQQMRNRYGDTEGTYQVYYAFLAGVISGIGLFLIANDTSPWYYVVGIATLVGGSCGYCTFYTI